MTTSCSVRMDDRPRQWLCYVFLAMAACRLVESGPQAQNILSQTVYERRVSVRVLFRGVPNRGMKARGLVVSGVWGAFRFFLQHP